jgi:hypothetical protein
MYRGIVLFSCLRSDIIKVIDMKKCILMMCLIASCFVLVGCGDSSDEAKSMTSLKGTTWEGSLSKYINGAEQHTFFVTVKFTGDHAATYSYNGGGSDFSYVVSGGVFVVSRCRYSNINGTWTFKKMDSKNLQIEKDDGSLYQAFVLKPKTEQKKKQ